MTTTITITITITIIIVTERKTQKGDNDNDDNNGGKNRRKKNMFHFWGVASSTRKPVNSQFAKLSLYFGNSILVCLSVCLCVCLCVCLSVCLSVCMSVCLSVCLPVCLSVRMPYVLKIILVRSGDRYIRSLRVIFIRRNRPYILKHNISPGNVYRTNVPYHIPVDRTIVPSHIPCHIIFPPHRAIIPYHRQKYLLHQVTISHTVPYIISTTPCHHTIPPTYHITYRATPHMMPYRTVPHTIPDDIILSIPYPTENTHPKLKTNISH